MFIGGHEDDPRAGAPLLWRQAERVGTLQPEGEKALERPNYGTLQSLQGLSSKRAGWGTFHNVVIGQRGVALIRRRKGLD